LKDKKSAIQKSVTPVRNRDREYESIEDYDPSTANKPSRKAAKERSPGRKHWANPEEGN
jgi:hypothetical protein